jgi:hypothetical protein
MIGELMPLEKRVELLQRIMSPKPKTRRRQLKNFARALVSEKP